jgi:hypothetical protein
MTSRNTFGGWGLVSMIAASCLCSAACTAHGTPLPRLGRNPRLRTPAGVYNTPPAPTPSSPPDSGVIDTLRPTIYVNRILGQGVDYYHWDIDTEGVHYDYASSTDTFWSSVYDLRWGVTVTWTCQAHNSSGYGPYFSPSWSFVLSQTPPPPAPTLSSPLDGSTLDTLRPSLYVHKIYGHLVDGYHWDFDTSGVHLGMASTSDTVWTCPVNLRDGVTLSWRCQAHNSAGYGKYSGFWSVTLSLEQVPPGPTYVSPPDGGSVNTSYPTLYVNAVRGHGVDSYKWDVDSSGVYWGYAITTDTSFTFGDQLRDGLSIGWTCKAHNSAGYGGNRPAWSFEVDLAGSHEDTAHYDGNNYTGVGLTNGGTFIGAVKFTSASSCSVKAVTFYHSESSGDDEVRLYGPGGFANPGTIRSRAPYAGRITGWLRVDLPNPVFVGSGSTYWAGVEVTNADSTYPLGVDAGPMVPWRGGYVTEDGGSTWYQLVDEGLNYNWNIRAIGFSVSTGIEEPHVPSSQTKSVLTSGAVPNPFTHSMSISFSIPRSARVVVNIMDVQGRIRLRLLDGEQSPGAHVLRWNADQPGEALLPSGVYYYRIQAGDLVLTGRVLKLDQPRR